MTQITTEEIKQKIANKESFLLDMYATWCGPCKVLMRNLTEVSQTLNESEEKAKYTIYKFDVDSDKEFAVNELGIRSVPTLKLFDEGKEVFSQPGVLSTKQIKELLLN